MFPGPVTVSTGSNSRPSVSVPPYASNATACAPPTPHTSSTPNSAHAASTVGCGRPPDSFCGGEHTTSDSTPAVCAGTTFMTTLDGNTAGPRGTNTPPRRTGTQRSVTVPPGTTWVVVS